MPCYWLGISRGPINKPLKSSLPFYFRTTAFTILACFSSRAFSRPRDFVTAAMERKGTVALNGWSSPSSDSDISSELTKEIAHSKQTSQVSDFYLRFEIDRRMPAFMNPVWRPLPHERQLYGEDWSSLDIGSDATSELSDENEEVKPASLIDGLLSNLRGGYSQSSGSDASSELSNENEEAKPMKRISEFHLSLADSGSDEWYYDGSLESPCALPSGHFSRKLFVGAVPHRISDWELKKVFEVCGNIRIIRPSAKSLNSLSSFRDGYVYVILEDDMKVFDLLEACDQSGDGRYLLPVWSRNRYVEVIPWHTSWRHYYTENRGRCPAERTVFVGGLHGTMTAAELAKVMQDHFGEVTHAGIDVDIYQYPIGSGRVTFRYRRNYVMAVMQAFIRINTGRYTKKVQIHPYLEVDGGSCENCGRPNAFQFCRSCLRNFCWRCFGEVHRQMPHHLPISRRVTWNR